MADRVGPCRRTRRRDCNRRAMLTRMAQESGVERPMAEDLARFDRKRKGKTLSNADRESPTDPDARIAKMKDGDEGERVVVVHEVAWRRSTRAS